MATKFRWSLRLALVAGLIFPAAALAALLGVTPQHPLILFASGNTTLSGGNLDITAAPVAVQLTPASVPTFINPAPGGIETVTIGVVLDNSCELVGGAGGDDLLVIGEVDLGGGDVRSGTLLTGEVAQAGNGGTAPSALFDFRFTVTGGLLSDFYTNEDIGVAVTSENSTFNGDCSMGSTGEAKGTLGSIPPILPAEGCTPGYWKQKHHFDSWVGFDPDADTVAGVFGPVDPAHDGKSLKEALKQGGGGIKALLRHATAALLNASSGDVNSTAFPTPWDVINAVQAAVNGGDIEATKDALEAANESGCPLN